MTSEIDKNNIDEWSTLLLTYFPDCRFKGEPEDLKTADGGEIILGSEAILPYIQTAFFKEHLLELQLDQSTRIFFSSIVDNPPELIEDEDDGEIILVNPDYEVGAYLKERETIALTPLTPGVGNGRIRSTDLVVLRFFSGTTAVELGSLYKKIGTIRGIPVIRVAFPVIGRINKSFRPYRVKAVGTVDAGVRIVSSDDDEALGREFQIVDVSGMGLSFAIPGDKRCVELGESVGFEVVVFGKTEMKISGKIRHMSKVRDFNGYKIICGVQFDLETRSLAAEIEQLAAAIQRIQLRELAEKTSMLSGVNILR